MATRKERRKQKKREDQQARQEEQTTSMTSGLSLARKAMKAEKEIKKQQKAQQDAEAKAKLDAARESAEEAKKALAIQEQSLREKEALLASALGEPETEDQKGGMWEWLRRGIAKTRDSLAGGLGRLLLGSKTIDSGLYTQLEELLITSDVGVETTDRLLEAIQARVRRDQLTDPQALRGVLRQEVLRIMSRKFPELKLDGKPPVVILFLGVNGTGKTTTIGKLAARFQGEGKKVLLAAGDTFRAAAGEQLERWAERTGAGIERPETTSNPSGVIHRAVQRGVSEGYDMVLCDTAGRLHTQDNLMEELKKIKRVIGNLLPGAPHETWLVLDANTGHNAILQTREFHKEIDVSGLVVTKLDGTARGGVVIGITNEFNLPIRFVGVGEGTEDLQPFSAEPFVRSIFD